MKNQDQFRPTCTVVICTRDRPAELNRCLEALAELDYPHFDVLVVNNAPKTTKPDKWRRAGERLMWKSISSEHAVT